MQETRSTKKRWRVALWIILPLILLHGLLKLWFAHSLVEGLLSVLCAAVWIGLEVSGHGVLSWIDEEVKPRKGEGSGGLL